DLVAQVPGQDQEEIRPGLEYALRRVDRNARSRKEAPLLLRAAVYRVVDEIGAYAAIVEQRVALGRRTISGDGLRLPLDRYQQLEERALRCLDLLRKAAIGLDAVERG